MNSRDVVAKNIRALREKYGDRQSDLSEKLHVNAVTVSGWETSKKEPSFEMLDKIAELYGVTTAALFSDGEEKKTSFPTRANTYGEFIQCLCAVAASHLVESAEMTEEQLEDEDGFPRTIAKNIVLRFTNYSRTPSWYETDEYAARLCEGGLSLVKAYKARTLSGKIFDAAMCGVIADIDAASAPVETIDDDELPF